MSKIVEDPSVTYLKKDDIGKVIATGLANIYQQKPSKPITYLAQWLLNYSKNMKGAQILQKGQDTKKTKQKDLQQENQKKQARIKESKQKQRHYNQFYQKFQEKINKHQYHVELLIEQLPQFLERYKKLTGVYIAEYNHPRKLITDDDYEENSHLSTDVPKLLNYFGSSKSHKNLMIGKTLSMEKGVTGEVFTYSDNQEGEKKKYLYVPDVVKNEKIFYFRIPKLGAYLAIPLVSKSYLTPKIFDAVLKQRKQYLSEKSTFEKEKNAQIQTIRNELQALRDKLSIYQQKNEAEHKITVKNLIVEAEQKLKNRQEEEFQYAEPDYGGVKKQYVICMDTLGQDREIYEQDREWLFNFTNGFKKQWEQTELRLLKQNVELHIQYENTLQKSAQQVVEQLIKQADIPEEVNKQLQARYQNNEALIKYHILVQKHTRLRSILLKPEIVQYLLELNHYRILKFSEIIQSALYLLEYQREAINIQATTILNWKQVAKNLFNQEFITKVAHYEFAGPKTTQFRAYAKVVSIQQTLQSVPEDQVIQYNVGMAILLKFLKSATLLRQEDVSLRHNKIQELRKTRQDQINQNKALEEDRQTALQQYKATIPVEQQEYFNEAQWLENYNKDHPLQQVEGEVPDSIDNDI